MTEALSRNVERNIVALPGVRLLRPDGRDDASIRRAAAAARVLIVRTYTRVDRRLFDSAPALELIVRPGSGLDNIDVEEAVRRAVAVATTPDASTVSVAELTIGHLLAAARRLVAADRSVRAGSWDRAAFRGVELRGRTLGVIGVGRIGAEVARLADGLGMRVLAHDPYRSPEAAAPPRVRFVPLRRLLEESQFVTVHTPLSSETRGLIGARQLAAMRRDAVLVNCARGGIVDERALAVALRRGRLAAAALDVFEREPPGRTRILAAPRVQVTPHLGAATEEAQGSVGAGAFAAVHEWICGSMRRRFAEVSPRDPADEHLLHPTLRAAEALGRQACRDSGRGALAIDVLAPGEWPSPRSVGSWAVRGFLAVPLGEAVSAVDALAVARRRGFRVRLIRRRRNDRLALRVRLPGGWRTTATGRVGRPA